MSDPTSEPLRSEDQIARAEGEPGVEPTDTAPAVARGSGEASSAHLKEDPYIGVRAEHLQPVRVGAEMAGPSIERGDVAAGEVLQDTADIPPEPSVWEALEDGEA